MREVIKLFFLRLFSSLAATVSSPWGWFVKIMVKPLADFATKAIYGVVSEIKNKIKNKKDKENATKYDDTLKDGATEQDQDSASSDLLNRN